LSPCSADRFVTADAVADTAHTVAAYTAIAFEADVDAAIDFVAVVLLARYSFSNQIHQIEYLLPPNQIPSSSASSSTSSSATSSN